MHILQPLKQLTQNSSPPHLPPGSFDSNKSFEDHGMRLLVHVLIKELLQRSLRGSGLHSRTFKERAYLPDCEWPQTGELAK